MKSDAEWFKEFQDDAKWPRHTEHKMIRAIQADALRHAAEVAEKFTVPEATEASITQNAIAGAILNRADALDPQPKEAA